MEEEKKRVKYAVIGLGLIGSAALRHLSSSSSSVLGIGPCHLNTPSQPSHGPFSSHLDQARLTRIVDPDPAWSLLAARSIAQYPHLQLRSGIPFHAPCGCIRVTPYFDEPGDSLKRSFDVGKANGAQEEMIQSSETLRQMFPYLRFRPKDSAIVEHGGAGYIDPRALIRAQLAIAAENGASILRDTVTRIVPREGGVEISTNGGRILLAEKALICAGSYSGFLLPRQMLDLRTKAVSIVLAEVGSENLPELQDMPSYIWRLPAHPFFHSVYGCPPLPYPDGHTYLKIGGTAWSPIYLSTYQQMEDWFHGNGNPEETQALLCVLHEMMPGIPIKSVKFKPCMVSYTAHNYPYIDAVDGKPTEEAQLFVAAGGCGAAAKSSDEIGRIAAMLVENGKWAYDLDSSLFRAVFTDNSQKAKL